MGWECTSLPEKAMSMLRRRLALAERITVANSACDKLTVYVASQGSR
jgi:hypothetical protein